MIIQVDQVGENVIQQLCDIALRQGGLQNLKQVNEILSSIRLLPQVSVEDTIQNEDKNDTKDQTN